MLAQYSLALFVPDLPRFKLVEPGVDSVIALLLTLLAISLPIATAVQQIAADKQDNAAQEIADDVSCRVNIRLEAIPHIYFPPLFGTGIGR